MKFTQLLSTASMAFLLVLPIDASAKHKEVVLSSSGNSVKDGFGGCVRHSFLVDRDNCKRAGDAVVYFDFNKHYLNQKAKKDLSEFVSAHRGKLDNIKIFKVSGYTDRIGSTSYNLGLSKRRAHSVAVYMKSLGVKSMPIESGRGISMVTGNTCNGLKFRERVKWLQPDRRADIYIEYK